MEAIAGIAAVLATIVLGLTAGALLAEGALLVPIWRAMAPEAFLSWYRLNGSLLVRFFGPLEVASVVLAIAAAVLTWRANGVGLWTLGIAALLATAVLAVFPLYFQRANATFAAGTIAAHRVEPELRRWASWHWVRTAMATAAFICALQGL